jgi:hypothetical protein
MRTTILPWHPARCTSPCSDPEPRGRADIVEEPVPAQPDPVVVQG